jgi:hypothetical protein
VTAAAAAAASAAADAASAAASYAAAAASAAASAAAAARRVPCARGWLLKKREHLGSLVGPAWRPRWVALCGPFLVTFESDAEGAPGVGVGRGPDGEGERVLPAGPLAVGSGALRVGVVLTPVLREPGTPEAERLASSRVQDQARVELEVAAPPEPMEQLMGWLGREGGPSTGAPPGSLREALVRWLTAPLADLSGLWTSTVEGDREAPVQLAALSVVATPSADGQRLNVVSVAVDNDARPLVGGLGLVLDQLLGQRLAAPDSGAGPRAQSIRITKVADSLGVELRFTAPLHHDTISGVRLLALGAGGWSRLTASLVPSDDHRAMRLTPNEAIPNGSAVQIFLPGQGEGPILGEDGQPLCGWWDDPLPAFGRGVDVSWVGIWSEVTP